jgi:hypothetical protein
MSKKRICYKVYGLLMFKIKKQKLLNVGVPPQRQGYRYTKESRLLWRGNSFWGFEKSDLKWEAIKYKWTKKSGKISNEEYTTTGFIQKWVPKMRLCPYEDQLIRGSAGVKDSHSAVTRGCAKIHVCTSYCEVTKVKRIRDCGIRTKHAVNFKKQKIRIVTRMLIQIMFKKATLLSRYCKGNRWWIKWKETFFMVILCGAISVISMLKNGYTYNIVINMTFLAEKTCFSLMRNPKKRYIYCKNRGKDCDYFSEHKGSLYSKSKKRVSVCGRPRLLQEEKKGENIKGYLWGISVYTND